MYRLKRFSDVVLRTSGGITPSNSLPARYNLGTFIADASGTTVTFGKVYATARIDCLCLGCRPYLQYGKRLIQGAIASPEYLPMGASLSVARDDSQQGWQALDNALEAVEQLAVTDISAAAFASQLA